MTNSIFVCQTTLNKVKFMEFGNKNANLTTLFTNTLSCLSLNDNFKAP